MAELDSFMGKFLTWNNSWSGMANMMGYALVFSVNLMGEKDQKHEDDELHGQNETGDFWEVLWFK